jgi:23S rRNA (adenine2503-C2)-methyltransferase
LTRGPPAGKVPRTVAAAVNLLNLRPSDAYRAVSALTSELGQPAYRTAQIFPRLWERPVADWGQVTNLPVQLRDTLAQRAPFPPLHRKLTQRSADGTVKFLWTLPDGLAVESVWIPDRRRITLCVSSQAGCAYGCSFCATGRMGFQRHLEPWEIVAQYREMVLDPEFGAPTNVVFMGMGEPLHNWTGVDAALTILNDAQGCGLGARRITVSTIGLIPQLEKLAKRPEQFRLAVSLHAPTGDRRAAIMPVERKYPLAQLIPALRQFKKRITLEYVMIQEANDQPSDARALAAIAVDLGAMINLLPLHPGGAPGLVPTAPAEIDGFARRLKSLGAHVTVRRSRGLDISAACGQLRIETAG